MKEKILLFLASVSRLLRGEVSTNHLIKQGMIVGKNFSRQGNCYQEHSRQLCLCRKPCKNFM